jgi:TM2 domain-containing membrane protein YozV
MGILLLLLVFALGIGVFALWIWSIVDILRSDFKKESDKIVWLVLVVGLHLLGSLLYLLIGTKQKVQPMEDVV